MTTYLVDTSSMAFSTKCSTQTRPLTGSFGMRNESDHGRLPPLIEAVPEIHQTNPVNDRPPPLSRVYYDPSRAPNQFPEARSLAPSPLLTSRSRQQYPPTGNQLERQYTRTNSESSSGHSDSYDKYGGYPSSTPHTRRQSFTQSMPSLPRASAGYPERVSEPYSLPSINQNGDLAHSKSYLPGRSSPHSGRRDFSTYYPDRESSPPLQHSHQPAYSGMYNADYQYSVGQYYERPSYDSVNRNGLYPPSFETAGDYSDGKNKRRRGNLPKPVTDILKAWFTDHVSHPYPTEDEKQLLMSKTGLTISQISNWFINARRRSLPQMTKQAQAEANLRDNQSSSRRSMHEKNL